MLIALAWTVAISASIPLAVLGVECLMGAKAVKPQPLPPPPAVSVIVPAHDEEGGIAPVLEAIRTQLRPQDRLLVIADNCTDQTAYIASRCGAEVVERQNSELRGKAYALSYAREILRDNPTPVVMIIDADCIPTEGAIAGLAATSVKHNAAVQGCYLLECGPDASPMVRVSTFAFLIKNQVRQLGLKRLGGHALLQGTGMAFPWTVFNQVTLETSSLVEDMKLGFDLLLDGKNVHFDPTSVFLSPASAQSATEGQRTRWEHGSIESAKHYAPKLLLAGLTKRPALLLSALDLMIPPLSLLVAGTVASTALVGAIGIYASNFSAFALLISAATACTVSLGIAWMQKGRKILPAKMIMQIPRYLVWKLPIYKRLVGAKQTEWVRTSRKP